MDIPRLIHMKRADKRQILVDHYLDYYLIAVAILKNDQDAKDAVQDAVVATMVKSGVRDPNYYCRQVLRNKCIDIIRHRDKLTKLDDNILVTDPEKEEMLQLLTKAKNELPFFMRTVIELHYEEEYTIEDISGKVGVSVSKVKRILAEAKDIIRKKMEMEKYEKG